MEEESNIIRETQMRMIGNIVHDSVHVSCDEKDNVLVRTKGEFIEKQLSHNELIIKIQGVDCETGSRIAGNRGYFLKGPAVYLANALQTLALRILDAEKYEAIYPPLFMKEDVMKEVAQLTQFDEELLLIKINIGLCSTRGGRLAVNLFFVFFSFLCSTLLGASTTRSVSDQEH